jgi:hypothetical protein
MLGLGIVIASLTATVASMPSNAQVAVTCTAATATFVQTVGFPGAPVLVPMSLPVTVCKLPTNVQVIIPAFQSQGSVIVPRAPLVASCTSSFVVASSVTRETLPGLQVVQVAGPTVVALLVSLPATVGAPLIICF